MDKNLRELAAKFLRMAYAADRLAKTLQSIKAMSTKNA